MIVTRFAPSPTGLLHLGHVFAAQVAAGLARRQGGRYRLRIEDIDQGRCRPEFDAAIAEDLAWLGLMPDDAPWRQSARLDAYRDALDRLQAAGLVYPCFCTRAEIRREIAAIGAAPHGPDGPLYPGTCRSLDPGERRERLAAGAPHCWRLDVAAAAARAGPLDWHDQRAGRQRATPEILGDAVLARRDSPTSYHLAVVVDDAAQGITLVTRGEDLFPATHLHRLLQALLDLPVPAWHHHRLIVDDAGRRLAKRDDARAVRTLRAAGHDPADVLAMTGFQEDGDAAIAPPSASPGISPAPGARPRDGASHAGRPPRPPARAG